MKKKFLIFSVGRSDYSIMRNIIITSQNTKKIKSYLCLSDVHNQKLFGKTYTDIKKDNIKNILKIKKIDNGSKLNNTNKIFSFYVAEADKILKRIKPKTVLLLGDRFEMLAIAIASFNLNIPICHFCGGSITKGAHDNEFRYSISKMAYLHFVETIDHKKNLIKLDIPIDRIFKIGAPALENLKNFSFNKKKIFKIFHDKLIKDKKIILCTFHSETKISLKQNIQNLKILINALSTLNENIIFTYPNRDHGYKQIIDVLKKNEKLNKIKIIKNLGIHNYYQFLKYSHLMVGNSSSGIIESGFFKIPTINMGKRQEGRIKNINTIDCDFKRQMIINKARKLLNFKRKNYKFNDKYKFRSSSKNIISLIDKKIN
jgi:GDP/UDP-N,N'-diacetylbacillosamine 2-epimerase (hydrolysing)